MSESLIPQEEKNCISIEKASKSFKKKVVLQEVTIQLQSGISYGLLGKNGAGKSTLINMIAGLTTPTTGSVLIYDEPAHSLTADTKHKIGILTEQLPLQEELTGWEQLWMVGLFYNLPKNELKPRIESLFDYFFDDRDAMKKRIGTYSTGMRKKIGLMAAVLNNPDILILDEPFSGIDPVSATRMIDFFKSWMNPNRLLLISSHNLDQVEKMVSHLIVVHQQNIIYTDTVQHFTGQGLEKMETKLYEMLHGASKTLDDVAWLLPNYESKNQTATV
jgi:ABC-type multidrug transport system ATPase subunit